jgi:hypothetical protein
MLTNYRSKEKTMRDDDLIGRLGFLRNRLVAMGHYCPSAWEDAAVIAEAMTKLAELYAITDTSSERVATELYKGEG